MLKMFGLNVEIGEKVLCSLKNDISDTVENKGKT